MRIWLLSVLFLLPGVTTLAQEYPPGYVDPMPLLQKMQHAPSASTAGTRPTPDDLKNDPLADMVSVVVADTEDVWKAIFASQGRRYAEPTLVMFSNATRSACGLGQAAMGPFYCPADKKAYIDLSFYDQMRTRFRAPGDFAQTAKAARLLQANHRLALTGTPIENHLGELGSIFEFLEVFYNRKRRPSSPGYLSPEAFEATRD